MNLVLANLDRRDPVDLAEIRRRADEIRARLKQGKRL
jgi:hypothetical protein